MDKNIADQVDVEELESFEGDSDLLEDAMDAAMEIERRHHKKEAEKSEEEVETETEVAEEESAEVEAEKVEVKVESSPSDSKLKADFEALQLQHKRLAADFENFRRRQELEKEDLLRYGAERVILEVLPVIDNFERAISSSENASDVTSVLEGIKMIHKQLDDSLKKSGVAIIEAVDKPFDPNFHNAVQQITDEEKPDQTVVQVLQKGYTLNGRVVRPSMVVVSTNS